MLSLPIPMQTDTNFPIVQYADDTLIIMEDDPMQLFFLKKFYAISLNQLV